MGSAKSGLLRSEVEKMDLQGINHHIVQEIYHMVQEIHYMVQDLRHSSNCRNIVPNMISNFVI